MFPPYSEQSAVLIYLPDNSIRCHNQNKSDNRLVYTSRRRHSDIVRLHQSTVNIGVNGLRHLNKWTGILCDLIKQAKIRTENSGQ